MVVADRAHESKTGGGSVATHSVAGSSQLGRVSSVSAAPSSVNSHLAFYLTPLTVSRSSASIRRFPGDPLHPNSLCFDLHSAIHLFTRLHTCTCTYQAVPGLGVCTLMIRSKEVSALFLCCDERSRCCQRVEADSVESCSKNSKSDHQNLQHGQQFTSPHCRL